MKKSTSISSKLNAMLGSRGRVKTLKTLVNYPNSNIDQLAKKSGLTRESIQTHLNELVRGSLAAKVHNGGDGLDIYYLNEKDARVKAFKELLYLVEGTDKGKQS